MGSSIDKRWGEKISSIEMENDNWVERISLTIEATCLSRTRWGVGGCLPPVEKVLLQANENAGMARHLGGKKDR